MTNALKPIVQKIGRLIARGAVATVNAASKMQTLQLRLMAGEIKDGVEHFEPFGFTSKPLPGAEHITLFFDGDRSHGVTVVVADRRHRPQNLQDGEVAVHDAYGNKVHFLRDGTLQIVASAQVRIDAPVVQLNCRDVQMTGDLTIAGVMTAKRYVRTS